MKKILFFAGIVAFSFVSAQKNDSLDIQKLLQNRWKQEQQNKLREQNPLLKKVEIKTFSLPVSPQARLSHKLSDGSNVYLLPQDNMPCLEPDMNKYNNMPNLASQKKYQLLLLPDEFITPRRLNKIPNFSAPGKWKITPDNSNK